MRDYSQAFFWLSDAKIINCCYNSTEPSIGLKLNEERTTLKCYMGDTGLLISHAFDERGIVSADLYRKLMFDKLEVNEGMLVENIVAQIPHRSEIGKTLYADFIKKVHSQVRSPAGHTLCPSRQGREGRRRHCVPALIYDTIALNDMEKQLAYLLNCRQKDNDSFACKNQSD